MATYRYDFTIAGPQNSGLTYPVHTSPYSTYLPDSNIIFKQGDTIQVRHTHPQGLNINYTGPDVHGADPDPTNVFAVSGTPGSTDVSRTLTWSSTYNSDYFTKWFFFAPNTAGGNVYSSSIIFKKVSAGLSASATQVIPGGTITFTGTSITGITQVASNGNRLYISIFDSSGTLITSQGSSGLSWSVGSSYLGRIGSTDNNSILTVGANMTPGVYTAYLTHFNGATALNGSTSVGNRFFGSEQRLNSGLNFTVLDNTPDVSSYRFTDLTGQAVNTLIESNVMTPSGYDTAATVGMGAVGNERAFRIAGGSYVSAGSTATISPGQSLQLRIRSSASNSTALNSFVAIGGGGGVNVAWAVTTTAAVTDTTPDAFSFNDTTAQPDADVISNSVTLAGYTTATTITAIASGTTVSVNGAAFTNTIGTAVPTSASIRIKITAGSDYSTAYTGRVTVGGTQSALWTVTTNPDNTGVGVGSAGSSANYGVKILNDGNNAIFSPNMRTTNFVDVRTITNIAAGATVAVNNVEGVLANNSSDILISVHCIGSSAQDEKFQVTRTDGGFTIKNNSAGTRSVKCVVMRV
tara:strand:- start:1543 stop:3276 length:1734 start_codon:yes stop_codon:yes gene_type:complete